MTSGKLGQMCRRQHFTRPLTLQQKKPTMKQVVMVAVPVVVTGVLVQWGHVMVGVVVGIAATIMLFHQRNQVDIEGAMQSQIDQSDSMQFYVNC